MSPPPTMQSESIYMQACHDDRHDGDDDCGAEDTVDDDDYDDV